MNATLPSPADFIEMMGGSAELALEIVLTAQKEIAEQIPFVKMALQERDAVRLRKILHSIRGSSSTLGAVELPVLIRSMEDELEQNGLASGAAPQWTFSGEELLEGLENYHQSLQVLETGLRTLPPED